MVLAAIIRDVELNALGANIENPIISKLYNTIGFVIFILFLFFYSSRPRPAQSVCQSLSMGKCAPHLPRLKDASPHSHHN